MTKIYKMHSPRNAHSDDHPGCSFQCPKMHLNECTNTFAQRDSEYGTIATLFYTKQRLEEFATAI